MQESTFSISSRFSQVIAVLRQRKRLVFALIGGVVVLVLLVIVVPRAFAPKPPPPNGAERLAASFYTAIQQTNYTLAYGMLADQQQAEINAYAFTLYAREQDNQYGPVTAFQEVRYDRDTNHVNESEVQERVSRGPHTRYLIVLTMQQQSDGTWKILSEDRAI